MKRKKTVKRVLIGTVIFFFLVIGALIAIPFVFKDEIIAAVKDAANENLNAKVDFKDVKISLIKSFPDVGLSINDYQVTGINEFEGIQLISGESFSLDLDFWSAWNFGEVPLEIKSVHLEKPAVNILVLSNGLANYDIAKPSTDTTSTAFHVKLQEYSIAEGSLTYDDRQAGTLVKAMKLNHSGKGDFTQDVYDLLTKTSIEELTVESGGFSYLKKANVTLDAGFNIDLPNAKYTLKENVLRINSLETMADGWVSFPNETETAMDLTFKAPQSDFKSLFSVIPNAYVKGYENVKVAGTFNLDGFVKGTYSDKPEKYPSFKLNLTVNDGDVKYPELPLGISGINAGVVVNSPTSELNQMLVDISRFNLKIGSNPIEGYFKLRTPISDPDVDTRLKGVINLEELSKAFPMEGIQTLNGIINTDLVAKAKMSTIDKGDYTNVNMSGSASIKDMNYVSTDMPPLRINSLRMNFTPRNVRMEEFDMLVGKSDIKGNGTIDNILAYFSPDATLKGNFYLRSYYFNADEWMSEETAGSPSSGPAATGNEELFDQFDITMDAAITKLDYDIYKVEDAIAKGHFTPNKMTVSQLSGKIGESDFSASGHLTNIWNYLFKNETLGGELQLSSKRMNLNQFMAEESAAASSTPAATEPILVPSNIDLVINAQIGSVTYTNMDLSNVKGRLIVSGQSVRFEDMTGNTLGGNLSIEGGYNTQDPEKPKFDLAMELQRLDFQKAFNTFNTFKILAPIGKYIEGAFTTKLKIGSDLKKDLMPDLATLNADGFLHTLNGAIKGFKPFEEIGNKLNVDAFKQIVIKDSKNWFTVSNGAVELKEFSYKYQDIDMKIAGTHRLQGDMSYSILAKIPREKIGKNALGAAANSGLDFLSKEASKAGINIDAGEFVNVLINIGGELTSPKLSFKVLGAEGSASLKDAIASQVKEEVKGQIDEAKSQAQEKFDEEKKKAEEAISDAAQKAKDEAAKKLEEEAKKAGEEVKSKVGEEVKSKVGEEAKKKLEELNPLKKNKKGGGG